MWLGRGLWENVAYEWLGYARGVAFVWLKCGRGGTEVWCDQSGVNEDD